MAFLRTSSRAHPRRPANSAYPRGHHPGYRAEPLEPRCLLSARIIHVDAAAPGVTQNGAAWSTAYLTLPQALSAAASGDSIWIAHGTYTPTTGADRTFAFALSDGVKVYGGYAGYGAANGDARDTVAYTTILSGDIGTPGNSSDNSYHVVEAGGTSSATVLNGVTIRDGYSNNTNPADLPMGAALEITTGSPTISNVTFTNNTAGSSSILGYGGAVYCGSGSTATFTGCAFQGNSASYQGGAVFCDAAASPTFTNCTFQGNTAISSSVLDGDGDAWGGAVAASAVNSSAGTVNFTGCRFVGNSCQASSTGGEANGGAIYLGNEAAAVTGCMFVGNSGWAYDASYVLGGTLCVVYAGPVAVTNCAFIGSSGCAVYAGGSAVTIANSTFTANSGQDAGAVYTVSGTTSIVNSILWNDTGTAGEIHYDSPPTVAYSDVQVGFVGTGNTSADPKFVRAPSAGTGGSWTAADADFGDLYLGPASSCIDTGGNSGVPAGISTDIIGNPRIVDYPGVGTGGAVVDKGAYETQLPSTCTWASPTNGAWTNTANWFSARVPGSTDDVIIPAGGAATITSAVSIRTLSLAGKIVLGTSASALTLAVASVGAWTGSSYTGLTGLVASGYASGAWNGPGISSSAAAGDSTHNHGLSIIATAGGARIQYGWNGDLNGDGSLTYLDYGVIDNAYLNHSAPSYAHGDLNFDGVINYLDYGMMDNAFLGQNAPAAVAAAARPAVVTPGASLFATTALATQPDSDQAGVLTKVGPGVL